MTVLAILLYLGGGLVVVYALIGVPYAGSLFVGAPAWVRVVVGLLYLGLARALQLRSRWAWYVMAVLSGIGLVLAATSLGLGGPGAIGRAVWPAAYLVLLTRPSVRHWFTTREPGTEAE